MLSINKELFQWEKERYLDVSNSNITAVEFYNSKSKRGQKVNIENGQALIPNSLLKESLPITALACIDDKVISRKTFKVLARPKPDSYIDGDDGPDIPGIDVIYDGGVIV